VNRVIDNTFSTIVMVQTPGGSLLRYECSKESWARLGGPRQVLLYVAPEYVMPLYDGEEKHSVVEEKKSLYV